MSLAAGFHLGVPMNTYLADPAPDPSASAGALKTLVYRSPAHCYAEHPRLGAAPREGGRRSDIGSIRHGLLLGGSQAVVEVPFDDFRTKAAREMRDTAYAEGKIPIIASEVAEHNAAVDVARKFMAQLGEGDAEGTMIWQDGPTWCRARPDWLSRDRKTMVDYKTAENANPIDWARRSLMGGDYHISAAHYTSGAHHLFGVRPEYVFLVQELAEPYLCSWVGLDMIFVDLGEAARVNAMNKWRECIRVGSWPGYSAERHYASPPKWLEFDMMERGIVEADAGREMQEIADASF